MDEEWRDIPNHIEYQVSDNGNVRSFYKGPWYKPEEEPHYVKPWKTPQGYTKVSFRGENGKHKPEYIHRLVMLAFTGPCPEGMEVAHNNGIRDDNRLENLRYDTRRGNNNDRVKHGTQAHCFKLNEEDVRYMRENYKPYIMTYAKLGKMFGVDAKSVELAVKGINWSHLD